MPGFLANGHALMQDLHLIPARKGSAARMRAGQVVRVVNTHGSQVVDFWAFNDPDLGECMSMEHTRGMLCRLTPQVGDRLYTNQRLMNIPVRNGTELSFEAPVGKAGDSVCFRAEMDCVVAFSACPQDMLPINGSDCFIHDAHYALFDTHDSRV